MKYLYSYWYSDYSTRTRTETFYSTRTRTHAKYRTRTRTQVLCTHPNPGLIGSLSSLLCAGLWSWETYHLAQKGYTGPVQRPSGPQFSIRWHLTSIGNPIVEIRGSYDRHISTMEFPILVRWHLYIESRPRTGPLSCAVHSMIDPVMRTFDFFILSPGVSMV